MTIQLDGLGRKLRDLPIEPIVAPDSAEGPVFVDESGRRSKKFRRIGWVLAAACACYAITLVAAPGGGAPPAPRRAGVGVRRGGRQPRPARRAWGRAPRGPGRPARAGSP
ncbi:hypothetical protein ACWGJT_30280, partial [Streptomyces xantholiticus]